MVCSVLVGLDLFKDDTHPLGHISRPTHVNVSQGCFHSLNKLLKPDYIVQVGGLVEINKLHQIGGDSNLFSVSVLSGMSLMFTMKRKYPELIPMVRHILF